LKDTTASNVRIVDNAEVPRTPIKPNRSLNFLASLVVGLVLGVGSALLVEHADNTIKDQQDIARIGRIPVVGIVPEYSELRLLPQSSDLSAPQHVDLASHVDSRSVFAEAFKSVRTSLLLAAADRPPKIIVVSSCEPQDGKSTVAINLATVLAQLGRNVLLVDGDLRKPRLHRVLQLKDGVGLSTLLTGNSTFAEVVQDTEVPQLHAITSGPIPPNPSELLGSRTFSELTKQLRERSEYDHVLVDSPPLMSVADPIIIAQHVDSILLVVRAGKTPKDMLVQSISKLGRVGARLAGAVLNGASSNGSYYYYRTYSSHSSDVAASTTRRLRRSRAATRRAANR
jgi:receptor protein-tyrosine kinase